MIEAEWWDYDDVDELAGAVAGDVGFIIESALDARGQALIALPGDAWIRPAFEKLAANKLSWKRVTIIPTNDRLVPVTSAESRVAALAKTFIPLGARVLPIGSENADYRMAGKAADARLADLQWPPDLVWLGVGEDGHTAGIVAGPDLEEALNGPKPRRALGTVPAPGSKDMAPRVTLSRASILSARTLLLTVNGKDKRKMVERAIKDGRKSALPIGLVLAETEVPVDIHWCA
jgi:6-phosphogluconolactonase